MRFPGRIESRPFGNSPTAMTLSPILCLAAVASALAADPTPTAPADYPIRPVSFTQVRFRDGLWASRIETNRRVTVAYDFAKCEETGRIENFAVAGGLKAGGFRGIFFNDSDVFKVIEGAAYCLALQSDPGLDQYLDRLISQIAAAQEDDGYLYTARTIADPNYNYPGREARWSHLAAGHELYNVGHLYEAAVAHYQATGKRTLLDVALKNADLVCQVFGPAPEQRFDAPGHEEIEIGLVKLYRTTGDPKYLRQAKFFIDARGRADKRKLFGPNVQDHQPVSEQREAVGHAVRAGYLYAGVADVAALTGDAQYLRAIDPIWEDIVSKKLYLTGGVGASRHGESFGGAYQLPNDTAYNETCAAIALALFNQRMFLLRGDAKYIDVVERIIYNGFLAGVSLEGNRFFYPNPLACDGRTRFNQGTLGRSPWFDCSCCPVNVVRFLPSLAGYVYATREDDIYVNLFADSVATVQAGQRSVTLSQETNYPWDSVVTFGVEVQQPTEFTLRVRIPGWARGEPVPSDLYRYLDESDDRYVLRVNGAAVAGKLEKGYAVITRTWRPGDQVRLELPMPIRRVVAHQAVDADRGRVALERGPIVYCVEAVDHEGRVRDLALPDDAELRVEHRPNLLDGVSVIRGAATRLERGDDGSNQPAPVELTALPYYAWAHREIGEMAVWLPRRAEDAQARPVPTIASRARASASHVWPSDTLEALNDQQEPKSSGDHDLPRHTWWDRRGSREWVQYDFATAETVAAVEVYWFDDTGRGQCRVPKSWRLLYRDGQTWKPVENRGDYNVAKNQFNRLDFVPVKTDGLRIEVQLQPDFSGGILEWRIPTSPPEQPQ